MHKFYISIYIRTYIHFYFILDSCWVWREKPHFKATYEWETVCRNRQELEELVNSLSGANRAEKALKKVIEEEVYEIADKEERKKQRKERAELRKLIPVEVSITPTQLRSRGSRNERVRYNYDDDDIYGIDQEEEDNEEDDYFEDDDEENTSNLRRSSRKATSPVNRPPPTRWSNRLNRSNTMDVIVSDVNVMNVDSQRLNIEEEVIDMDTSPSSQVSEMDTRSPSPSIMDTTSSESGMETSRSQSIISNMDVITRPESAMEQ
jgi:hypothetical protein